MNDLALQKSADEKQRDMIKKFVITGVVAIIAITIVSTVGGYSLLRALSLKSNTDRISQVLSDSIYPKLTNSSFSQSPEGLAKLGAAFARVSGAQKVVFVDTRRKVVWASSSKAALSADDQQRISAVLADPSNNYLSSKGMSTPGQLEGVLKNSHAPFSLLLNIQSKEGATIGAAKLLLSYQHALSGARNQTVIVSFSTLLASSLLFFLLYRNFSKSIVIVEEQEEMFNQQVSRLSKLLEVNKNMQASIKTASARAVELNEQFLRRVGSDLHDGPAQMIGFANLRLNKVSKLDVAKQFGHEFHAVKDALEESLEEIRGISSGLVLPELEKMNLEQCLHKVVTLHGTKSKAEVAEYYQDLPEDIPLPIKICAYRFVQEGLNNAERHGKAEKCRLSAYVKNNELFVSLKDNGIGFRKSLLNPDGGHLGLVGLKDRIESLGGSFSINSELGIGTALKFSVKVSE